MAFLAAIGFQTLTIEDVLGETPGEIGVRCVGGLTQYDKIDDRQCRYQFSPCALGKKRKRRVGHFHHQRLPRLARLRQPANVFGEQRIEMSGHPAGRTISQPVFEFSKPNDLGSRIQEQSLTVMSRAVVRRRANKRRGVFPSALPATRA